LLDEKNTIPLRRNIVLTYRVIGVGLLVIMTVVMIAYSSAQSFWVDELYWTIGKVANKNFVEITTQLLKEGYNMPLYYYVLAIIYPLVPYGEGYLLSLSIAAIVIGILFLYFASKKIGGETLAFITLCTACLSSILMIQGGWEVRPYAFYFCFSALTMWIYFSRIQNENKKNILLLGVSMILLIYSHLFGVVLVAFYGIGDLFLLIIRKIKINCIISYLMAAGAALMWFIPMRSMLETNPRVYWVGAPRFRAPIKTIQWLLSNNVFLWIVFLLALVVGFLYYFHVIRTKKWDIKWFLWLQTLLCIGWVIGLAFFYSRWINPNGSVYLERYFFSLVPHALLIVAFGLLGIYNILKNGGMISPKLGAGFLAVFFLMIGVINYQSAISTITSIFEPYREVAEYLTQTGYAYEDRTLIAIDSANASVLEYYYSKRGYDLPDYVEILYGDFLLIAKNGAYVFKKFTVQDIMEYDKVYYARIRPDNRKDAHFLEFMNENYVKTWEDERISLTLYKIKE